MSELTLRVARTLAGLSQTELDDRAKLQRGTVHDLEAGRNKRPSHEVVTRIVRALQRASLPGVTAETLFPVPEPEAAGGDLAIGAATSDPSAAPRESGSEDACHGGAR